MIIEADARDELLAAASWYDDQRDGLGADFLDAVDEVLARIAAAPRSFPSDRFDDRARRALLSRFPYVVVFVVTENDVRVVAVVHAKRLPHYWTRRI